jgi:hypothetical protein
LTMSIYLLNRHLICYGGLKKKIYSFFARFL